MIDNEARLAEWLQSLQSAPWIAIDTEADSLHAYPEKLCLLQVGIAAGNFLVDPLAGLNLSPVLEVFMLRKDLDFVPASVFDTMLGARLLGVREFGLNNLVSRFLSITLEKGPQKANWARRPLTPRMEDYARNDTAHLKPLAELIRGQLQEKGRLEWHREMCERLIADNSHVPPPDPEQTWRIKGSRHLPPRSLAVLKEIWQWREREAIAANRPPYFILSSETLIAIAASSGESRRAIEALLPRHLTTRRRRELLAATQAGREAKALPQVLRFRSPPPTEASKRRFEELERKRNQKASELELDPTLIASRATLVSLSNDPEKAAQDLLPWQRSLLK
ncbi:MAG: HRDC domain-containing protein [Verrucomicrobia bacterium]|nr:HRDC domain-containing protein [Verrucomicrobiota bacterium]